jgi:hypothetical protein
MAKPSRRFNYYTSFSFENDEDEELEFEISAHVNEYHKAKTYGLPEDCYPEEGGDCDDYEICLDGHVISNDEFEALGGSIEDLIEYIQVSASEQEPDEPDYDPGDRDVEDDCTDWDDPSRDP